jgi:hypothetical protein
MLRQRIYLTGLTSAEYMDPRLFSDAGVSLVYFDYEPVRYTEAEPFFPRLSMLDTAMYCSKEEIKGFLNRTLTLRMQ